MTTEEWIENAVAYFGGSMSAEDAALFEKETAASEELSELMQFWKNVDQEAVIYEKYSEEAAGFITTHQRLKDEYIEPVKKELPTAAREIILPAQKIKFSTQQWIVAAAVITGIIFMVELLTNQSKNDQPIVHEKIKPDTANNMLIRDSAIRLAEQNKDTQKNTRTKDNSNQLETLYADNFLPDEVPEDQNGPLDNAFFYYASGQYKNAIIAIDGARTKTATRGNNAYTPLNDFYASYYKALSLMSLDNTAAAIPLLQQALQQSPAEVLSIKAQWYLSLAYLEEEKISPAIEGLQSLTNNPEAGIYKSKAEKILAEINK